jgi:hypothetical protein
MRNKIFIIMTILSLLLVPISANAADVQTGENKATALNKLTILQGDGVNFNLNGQLKRSEAVAFIVRIMGKESLVKANADKYSNTTFTDVKSSDWFASYVGFCQENKILNGFPDGGFHPNNYISEKAFLKLVLITLGYQYDDDTNITSKTDFIWDRIYASSLALGLVSDPKYKLVDGANATVEEEKIQSTDNTKYIRADVVNVLYGSLTSPVKGSKKTIIDLLIEAKVVDRAIAVQLGFAKEIVQAKIDSVKVSNDTTLNIKFSKTILKLEATDITIYETDNKAIKLNATVAAQVYGDIVVNTSKQIPDKAYTIEINNKVEGSDVSVIAASTFIGFKTPEIKSNYFKISKVIPVSKNVINVYFTQPISSSAALPVYYEVFKNDASFVKGNLNNMTVKLLSEQNNVISLYLNNATIVDDAPYSLKLNGDILSTYGVQLNDGLGDSITFAANKQESEALKIDRLLVVNSKNLRLEFNKELDQASIQQISNYQISSTTGVVIPISNVILPSDGKGKALQLTTVTAFDKTLDYQIAINNVSDMFNLSTLMAANYAFLGKPTADIKDLNFGVNAIDKTTLQVYFDKPVDAVSAANNSFYMITGVTDPNFLAFPTKVYVSPTDPTFVKIYLPTGKELISTSSYKLKVLKQMLDQQGNTSSTDSISAAFNGSTEANVKPQILEAITIGKDTVKIKASKELSLSGTNLALNNYSLELKEGKNTFITKTPSSIIPYDDTTFILHFDELDVTKNYNFKFNSLTDYSGLSTRTFADGLTSVLLKNGETTP